MKPKAYPNWICLVLLLMIGAWEGCGTANHQGKAHLNSTSTVEDTKESAAPPEKISVIGVLREIPSREQECGEIRLAYVFQFELELPVGHDGERASFSLAIPCPEDFEAGFFVKGERYSIQGDQQQTENIEIKGKPWKGHVYWCREIRKAR